MKNKTLLNAGDVVKCVNLDILCKYSHYLSAHKYYVVKKIINKTDIIIDDDRFKNRMWSAFHFSKVSIKKIPNEDVIQAVDLLNV